MLLSNPNPFETPTTLVEFSSFDEGELAAARFSTTVEMTTASPLDLSPTAIYRLACHFILSRLSDEAVKEACEALVDIYLWQSDEALSAPARNWEALPGSPGIRPMDRAPFVFDED